MAAVNSSERRQGDPNDELGDPGGAAQKCETSDYKSTDPDNTFAVELDRIAKDSNENRESSIVTDGLASQTESSIALRANDRSEICNELVYLTSSEEKTHNTDEKSHSDEEMDISKDTGEEQDCNGGKGAEEEEEEEEGGEEDQTVKRRQCSLECKDCGKRFTRRETFNLHRHFHAHQDELASLTCKECGLTFHHRSSLIKHRSEHQQKVEQPVERKRRRSPQGVHKEERPGFQCDHCEETFPSLSKLRLHTCDCAPDKAYRCPLCRKEFRMKISITSHMQTHSLSSHPFRCQECHKSFSDIFSLRDHQGSHASLKPYACPECGMVFRHRSVMEDHRRKHTEDTQGPHLCNICGKHFKYSSLLQQHQYLHTGQKPFRCPDCGKTFALAQNMKAHCRQHRRLQAHVSCHETVGGLDKENTNHGLEPKRIFNCPLCPQNFPSPADLRAHMLIHEAEHERMENGACKDWETNRYTCPHCPATYSDQSNMMAHLTTHTSARVRVERQGNGLEVGRSAPLNTANVPGRWHREEMSSKPLKCPDCGKSFRHRSVLTLHMRIHSKDKPYQCRVCNKSFRFNSYLQQHMIIHTGEKPYKCPDCSKDFAFLQNMRTHQRLHTQKPFRCTKCRKGYSDENQLQRHLLSHNGEKPHKCHLCEKSFGLAYLLRDHLNTHTGERPHRCQECHKTFPWLGSLLVHQKIHARKRQGSSQPYSFPMAMRIRGKGSRGRSGGRLASVPMSRSPEWQRRPAQPQPTMFSSQMDMQQPGETSARRPPPVHQQWRVEGGELRPVPLPNQSQPSQDPERQPAPVQQQPSPQIQPQQVPQSPLIQQQVQLQLQLQPHLHPHWGNTPTTPPVPTLSSVQLDFPGSPIYMDGAALWGGLRTSPAVPPSQSTLNKLGQELKLPRWSSVSVPMQKAVNESPTPPRKEDTRVWDFNAPLVMSPTVSSSEKTGSGREQQKQWSPALLSLSQELEQQQQKHLSSSWTNVPTSTQNVPISIQYDPQRFTHGVGPTVWGFQTTPAGPQQQPMVTGTQIIINQTSPFFSPLPPLPPLSLPGSHPLHSVAVGSLPRPPHPNIFFTPQAVMSERPHMTQTLSLPQLAPRPVPHKLGRLPYAPDRLLQCMICGCSLPRELDLQMHYMQHAQGEI
uniref:C2H2-type domain-containing protein n=1 Tax=Oncorhynchus kisutch TaxID=8019 RepID=A0A8C7FT24_ONCKI